MPRIPFITSLALLLTLAATARASTHPRTSAGKLLNESDTLVEVDITGKFETYTATKIITLAPGAEKIPKVGDRISVTTDYAKYHLWQSEPKSPTPTRAFIFLKNGKAIFDGIRLIGDAGEIWVPSEGDIFSRAFDLKADDFRKACARFGPLFADVRKILAIEDPAKQRPAVLEWIKSHPDAAGSAIDQAVLDDTGGWPQPFNSKLLDDKMIELFVNSSDVAESWNGARLYFELTAEVRSQRFHGLPGLHENQCALAAPQGLEFLFAKAKDKSASGMDRYAALQIICWLDAYDAVLTPTQEKQRGDLLLPLLKDGDKNVRRFAAEMAIGIYKKPPEEFVQVIIAVYRAEIPGRELSALAETFYKMSPFDYAKESKNPAGVIGYVFESYASGVRRFAAIAQCKDYGKLTLDQLRILPLGDVKPKYTVVELAKGKTGQSSINFSLPELPPGVYQLKFFGTFKNEDNFAREWHSEPYNVTIP